MQAGIHIAHAISKVSILTQAEKRNAEKNRGAAGNRTQVAGSPDPYARGEGLVTCYTRSCSGTLYRAAPIRLQLHCVTIVMRHTIIAHCH